MVSPGKTWEGFLGGYLFALCGLRLWLWEYNDQKPLWFLAIFTLLICITSLLGDLFESWLKRRANIKDSGNILPGHGGFLDRFDGILFTVFFFFLFRSWLIAYFFYGAC
jgi:phosphatidate cytidylyltransferase